MVKYGNIPVRSLLITEGIHYEGSYATISKHYLWLTPERIEMSASRGNW